MPQFKLVVCVAGIYLLFTLYATCKLYDSRKTVQRDDYSTLLEGSVSRPAYELEPLKSVDINSVEQTVDIWSLTNAGTYLWRTILNGEITDSNDTTHVKGTKRVDHYLFEYHAGKGLSPNLITLNSDFTVLALNGLSKPTQRLTKAWLDSLRQRKQSVKLLLVLIGRENCNNDWIYPYMKSNGGVIDKLFIVYDTVVVNEVDIYQWPLGPALYRGFLDVQSPVLNLEAQRPHICNLVGTVYPGSSRENLATIIKENDLERVCYVNTRYSRPNHEESNSMLEYRGALLQSDLTLCPVGANTECYRIYEACELGSVPVVEDIVVDAGCNVPSDQLLLRNVASNGTPHVSVPLRLLKLYNAPFIFVKNWNELPDIIRHELRLFLPDIVQRRKRLVKWYEHFKQKIREHFLDVLDQMT